jgi:hypothetical protein
LFAADQVFGFVADADRFGGIVLFIAGIPDVILDDGFCTFTACGAIEGWILCGFTE